MNLLVRLACLAAISIPASLAAQELPRPNLLFQNVEQYSSGGKDWVRFRLQVTNRASFAPTLFVAAPNLPPCGTNKRSARAWVDIFTKEGKRLYGFCALGSPELLGELWFSVEAGVEPPRWVYVEVNDRQTSQRTRSNLAMIP